MQDEECVAFLQWALPRLHRRWPGFRKVRRTTCKRIDRRLRELALPDAQAYRARLERDPREWQALEALLPVTISRFYRDKAVFDFLGGEVLKELARQAAARGDDTLRAWSVGCASGEEPYTLMLLWRLRVQPTLARPQTALRVLGTDVEPDVLERARAACYPASSVRQLPPAWLAEAFTQDARGYCLRPEYRAGVDFRRRDVLDEPPEETFDLILCRNLVLTYFDPLLQAEALQRTLSRLRPGGGFVIGRREALPSEAGRLTPWSGRLGTFRRSRRP